MHRLISARNLYPNSFHNLKLLPPCNALRNNPSSEIKCFICQRVFLGHSKEYQAFVRHQSTKTASALRALKKKSKHKNYKKYGEVLEVSEKAMTESKVSISKLKASHLSQLASSPVTLEQLHQLTVKTNKNSLISEVDTELLKSVREKILKSSSKPEQINLEDDNCALVFTHHQLTNIEKRFKAKQYLDMVKQSYYDFRKATIYDQRLQDLRYAIHEGLNQEFNFDKPHNGETNEDVPVQKGPHAVFRELFVDNHLDSYDQELMSHITNLQSRGMSHSALEDLYDDPSLEAREELEPEHESIEVQTLNVKKAKQAIRKKKKAKREKRRALQELSMKQDIKEIEKRGKQEALHRMLAAHLELLCSINMVHEGRQVLQYYRQKSSKPDHPKVQDVMIYNILLHGYAYLGLLENTKELLSYMATDKIKPNAQTFAAVFECIERSLASDKMTLLNFYHKQMQDNSITLNDLMDKSKFLYDQHDVVLAAIRKLQPDFNPQYTPPPIDYVCPLLDKLTLDKVEHREGLRSSPAEGLLSEEEMIERGRQQLEVELKGEVEVQNIYVSDTDSDSVKKYRKLLQDTENEWRQVLKEAFVRNLGTLKSQSNASHSAITLYPYLNVLTVDQFVDLMMGEMNKLVDGSETFSPTLKVLQRELGTLVYQKYQTEQSIRNGVLDKKRNIFEKYCRWYMNRDSETPYNNRQMWQLLMHENRAGASLDVGEQMWPMEIRQNIGKLLYNIIINDIKIDVNMFKSKAKVKKLPAVYKVHRAWGRLFRLELKPHPCVSRLCAAGSRSALRMRAPLLPTLAPPEPWRRAQPGLVRMPVNVMSQWKRLYEAPPETLYPVLDSLNQLGEVPWVVNKQILDLQLQIFRSGGDKRLEIASPSVSAEASVSAEWPAYRKRAAAARARAEAHSLWCDALYKLSLANHYRDRIFWLPHNMDFRGRVYACPPHLSQLGADTARALMKFARAHPLGRDGLAWLKLHAVNLTGTMKKCTVEERLAYADSILDKIIDSAEQPLEGAGWWKESEEPWQTLACCMEIANALRCDNPAEYLCGFPVHQDGSCNGLQHYAALGGDAAGAAAVNLAPLPRPMDVYSAVCALVEEMRKRDVAAGVPAAVVLENFVRRKVIKQTVMTTVYGVTRFGARLQIAKQLKDIDDFPKEHVWSCSHYLTTKTFDSLREMFTSTKLIQDWFTDCAKLISCVCGESVEWVTPLGLPVVQPYYRRAGPTTAPGRASLDQLTRPCTMKQRNAFPPNFIHSLDSSHMMLTGVHCQAKGLTFVSVHDCFWTHPDTVPLMNQICREQFVALHSQPILEDLSDFMVRRYSYKEDEIEDHSIGSANKKRVNSLLQNVPSKGDFDLNGVLKSVYFFS